MSPSWINLNLGPIGLFGIDFAGELQWEWKTPSSTLDCRDHWWNTDEVDDEEEDECEWQDTWFSAIRTSELPIEVLVLDTPEEWLVVAGDWASWTIDARTTSDGGWHEAIVLFGCSDVS